MPKVRMQDIPKFDRPREKMQRKGPQALSDFELLEVMVGSGTAGADVGQIARHVLQQLRKGTHQVSYESLTRLRGVSTAQASKILASLELAKRHILHDTEALRTQRAIVSRLADIRTKLQEHFVCLSLDGGHRLLALRTVTIGTLDTVLAHPREVFADPLVDRAAYVIVAHNHPSGIATPSKADITLTQQLAAAGHMLGIPLRDHIIITKTADYSFRANKLL